MTQKNTSKNSKRSFDFARNTMWSIDPEDLCIIGGKLYLDGDERGPLDTNDDADHELFDNRICDPLTEEFVANIDALGVDTPIQIAKINDVAVVIAGKTRVRAARVANRRRKVRGEPSLKIDCKIKRGTTTSLFIAMIAENENRHDDNVLSKIEKLKKLQNRGISEEDCAVAMGVSLQSIKGWLAFDDNATDETKKAAKTGRLSPSAAATLARIKDPDAQRKQLADLLSSGGKVTQRAAKLAAKRAGASKIVGVTDKKTLRRLLSEVQDTAYPGRSQHAMAWQQGVEDALKLVIGVDGVDARLTGKLDEVISLLKTEGRAKQKRKTAAASEQETAEVPDVDTTEEPTMMHEEMDEAADGSHVSRHDTFA